MTEKEKKLEDTVRDYFKDLPKKLNKLEHKQLKKYNLPTGEFKIHFYKESFSLIHISRWKKKRKIMYGVINNTISKYPEFDIDLALYYKFYNNEMKKYFKKEFKENLVHKRLSVLEL